MKHKSSHAWLVTAALLTLFAAPGMSQVGTGQMPRFPNVSVTGQTRSNAAATMRTSGLAIVPQDFAKLTLAPGFLMELNVLDDPDLVGSFRIDQQGDLALPIIGAIHVAGETVSEARIQIRNKLLADQILKNPQVSLTVLEYTAPEVTIVGEVVSPGRYPLLAPRKLVDVLALAGGTTLIAGNEVQITRGSVATGHALIHYSRATDPKTVEDVIVNPGDTVQVKRAGIVYVLGAVNRPGGYVMEQEGTLSALQAISLANGTALTARTGTIHLLRRNGAGTTEDIALQFEKMSRGKTEDVQLHESDVLYVQTSKLKSILTNTQSIMASVTSASIYAVAVH